MQTEIEAKFLNIDATQIREKLKRIGARLVFAERLMKRKVFDYPDSRLEKIGGWIRVRDEGGGKITFSYKRLVDRTVHGTKEITVDVSNFETTCQLLSAIELEEKSFQETKREKWLCDTIEITIDTWPWIPTFVELEANTEDELKEIVHKLGLDWSQALHGSVETAYQKYYDVTEQEINSWKLITFNPVPGWLETKRKPVVL